MTKMSIQIQKFTILCIHRRRKLMDAMGFCSWHPTSSLLSYISSISTFSRILHQLHLLCLLAIPAAEKLSFYSFKKSNLNFNIQIRQSCVALEIIKKTFIIQSIFFLLFYLSSALFSSLLKTNSYSHPYIILSKSFAYTRVYHDYPFRILGWVCV